MEPETGCRSQSLNVPRDTPMEQPHTCSSSCRNADHELSKLLEFEGVGPHRARQWGPMHNSSRLPLACSTGASQLSRTLFAAGVAVALSATAVSGVAVAGDTTSAQGPSGLVHTVKRICASGGVEYTTDTANLRRAVGYQIEILDEFGGSFFAEGSYGGPSRKQVSQTESFYGSTRNTSLTVIETDSLGNDVTVISPQPLACPNYETLGRTAFTPLSPTRVLDTRAETLRGYVGAKPVAGQQIRLPVVGLAGVPLDASAVVINVTIAAATSPGYVEVVPAGSPLGGTSTVNAESAGQTIANSMTVPVGTGGAITLFTERGGHLIVDVFGYYRPVTGSVRAGRLQTVAAQRVLDTRPTNSIGYRGPKPTAGQTVTVDVASSVGSSARSQMLAAVVNVTIVDASAAGFVQAGAAQTLRPFEHSNLNASSPGETIAGLAIVPVTNGQIDVFTESGAHLLVDVVGWFTNSTSPLSTAGLFVPVTPERVVDTRTAVPLTASSTATIPDRDTGLAAGTSREIFLAGIPDASAVLFNVTATGSDGPGWIQAGPYGEFTPGSSSTLNIDRVGHTIANSAIVASPSSNSIDNYSMYSFGGGQLVVDFAGFFTT
jgi:hypothetical protein